MCVRLRHVALHYDSISDFVDEKRKVGRERNAFDVGNQDGEWIRFHECEGSGAIFLAVEFGYVHSRISWLSRCVPHTRARAVAPHVQGCCGMAIPCP